MNRRFVPGTFIALLAVSIAGAAEVDQADLEKALPGLLADYGKRQAEATAELAKGRREIADEKVPLVRGIREWHERVLALESEVAVLEIERGQGGAKASRTEMELGRLNDNLSYLTSVARDAFKDIDASILAGGDILTGGRRQALAEGLADPARQLDAALALDTTECVVDVLAAMLGGHVAPGSAVVVGDTRVVNGTYAWVGPDVYFQRSEDGAVCTVRTREGSPVPVAHPLGGIDDSARKVFRGARGMLPVDASGGKALRLEEARGGVRDHLRKGGMIGYVILGFGFAAIVTILVKLRDARDLAIDPREVVLPVTRIVETGTPAEAAAAVGRLRRSTRELFEAGLQNLDKAKVVVEEQLYAVLLVERMRHERRLPYLAVIVAAAPLLGLLGTVTGMIKTFTLITVFGTGNAAKLSSGISEALVTTELGLIVAVPTLVVHAYLGRRLQKNLSLLEQYAAEFVVAVARRKERATVREPERVTAR